MALKQPTYPRLHTRYDPPADPGIDFSGSPSMTKQEFKDEQEMTSILARYKATGFLPGHTPDQALYGDFSQVGDYLDAQNRVLQAREAFAALPARVRDRFGHDPAQLVAFVADPRNRSEAERLGLVPQPPPPAPSGPGGPPPRRGGRGGAPVAPPSSQTAREPVSGPGGHSAAG